MFYFIFDLDDTLYQTSNVDNKINIIDYVDKNKLKELEKYGKIILFSNANNIHCKRWLEDLQIKDSFSVIITHDTFKIYKPNPLVYNKLIEVCGIKNNDDVFFFDDLPINLLPGHKKNWNTILIKKNYIKKNSDIYINNIFNTINLGINNMLLFLDN